MQNKRVFFFLGLLVLLPISSVYAFTHTHLFSSTTGTQLRLAGTLTNTELRTGTNSISFSLVYLVDPVGTTKLSDINLDIRLNSELVASHDFADFFPADITSEKDTQNATIGFRYSRTIGETIMDVRLSLTEEREFEDNLTYVSDWVPFFFVKPVTFWKDFYLYFIVGGIVVFSVAFSITILYVRRRKRRNLNE